jgi:hypothetical protein
MSRMLDESVGPVTIHQALDALGDRSFGGVMLLLALPALVLPPGISAVLGAPRLLVCAQLLLLRPRPWLPSLVGRCGLRRARAERVFAKAIPILARAESWTRPRLPQLLFPLHEQIIALAGMSMSLALILPLPLAHTASALGISAFGIGLIERDGVAIVVGWLLAAASGGLTLALFASAIAGLHLF